MKLPALCTLALVAAAAASHGGSFGGPPPFTDLSPLQSGIDGSYQATARGENLTGIIRFAYQNGVQSTLPNANIYSFFVAGDVVSGNVIASIQGKDLAGVLGGQDFSVPSSSDGSTELPLVFIVRGNRANGSFEGHLDLEDRMSAFEGDGQIAPANTETNTVIGIAQNTTAAVVVNALDVVVTNFEIPGSNIIPTTFEFKGVRTSLFAQGSGGGTTTATP
jgi:hypothetical protein